LRTRRMTITRRDCVQPVSRNTSSHASQPWPTLPQDITPQCVVVRETAEGREFAALQSRTGLQLPNGRRLLLSARTKKNTS